MTGYMRGDRGVSVQGSADVCVGCGVQGTSLAKHMQKS